jgi:L-amino acid N-acyltransferase YncA
MLNIVRATLNHLESITDIYNDAVLTSTATFDTEPVSLDDQRLWFNEHNDKFPIYVAMIENEVVGWASLSRWSGRCAYENTAEISIYIKNEHQGKHIGTKLLQKILEDGKAEGLHTVIARIAEGSEISIKLHEKAGFEHIGIMKEVGEKFGKLLDVYLMQLIFK